MQVVTHSLLRTVGPGLGTVTQLWASCSSAPSPHPQPEASPLASNLPRRNISLLSDLFPGTGGGAVSALQEPPTALPHPGLCSWGSERFWF